MANSPDAETVAALDRAIQAAAKRLSALGMRMAAIVRRGDRAFENAATERIQAQLSVACQLVQHLIGFGRDHGISGSLQTLQSCATLPLECGHALMAKSAANSNQDAQLATYVLSKQALLVLRLVGIPTSAQLLQPEPLLAWLSGAASRALALSGTSLGRGLLRNLQLNLCYIATAIASYPPFTAHAAALQLDVSLQRSMVQLLELPLHAAAEVLQLPATQRCDEPNGLPLDWALVSDVMGTLMSDVLTRTFQEQQAVTNSADRSHASRLLQTAAQLFAAALASAPNGVIGDIPASLCGSLLVLLSLACREHGRAILQQQQGWQQGTESRRDLARQLLPALLKLPIALRLQAERAQLHADPAMAAARTLRYASILVIQFNLLASSGTPEMIDRRPWPEYSLVGSLDDVPACCAAAGAMVRALPHVAALEAQPQPAQWDESGAADYRRGQLAAYSVRCTIGLASAMRHYCQCVGSGGPWSAAAATAAAEALWQLHTTLCRGIHAGAAGLTVAHPLIPGLLAALADCWNVHVCMNEALQGRAASSDADVSDSKPRHLLAMSVAQAEAVMIAAASAVLVAAASQPPPADEMLASTMLSAIKFGPAALSSSPPVQQALDNVFGRFKAGEASSRTDYHRALLANLQYYQQQRREPQPGDALELAQAAATRSCAYLRCANLASEGGPAAGKGAGTRRCSKCRVAQYCDTACSRADWRAGHRRTCGALGAARVAERERAGVEG
ncbi:hypothetical protein D9Q98_003701 [Chlorella vulgaris]|uniref:MYND-type domain-containing protein n=1 Tax=Chlorella vulgaris TaxID=3077 RepID=A0A9D4TTL1_CHLVU|nr:hypothetical protein D9Q98_003701 [Chlorella vulgaris]